MSREHDTADFKLHVCLMSCLCVLKAVCGYGAQDALPFRSVKEGELFFTEDRDINLVELALATNIPKGCAETMVRGMTHCAHRSIIHTAEIFLFYVLQVIFLFSY